MVLESESIRALQTNNRLLIEFPFLAKKSTTQPARCCGGRSSVESVDYNQIKMSIAGLDEAKRKRFKELAGVERVKINYHLGGQIITIIF